LCARCTIGVKFATFNTRRCSSSLHHGSSLASRCGLCARAGEQPHAVARHHICSRKSSIGGHSRSQAMARSPQQMAEGCSSCSGAVAATNEQQMLVFGAETVAADCLPKLVGSFEVRRLPPDSTSSALAGRCESPHMRPPASHAAFCAGGWPPVPGGGARRHAPPSAPLALQGGLPPRLQDFRTEHAVAPRHGRASVIPRLIPLRSCLAEPHNISARLTAVEAGPDLPQVQHMPGAL